KAHVMYMDNTTFMDSFVKNEGLIIWRPCHRRIHYIGAKWSNHANLYYSIANIYMKYIILELLIHSEMNRELSKEPQRSSLLKKTILTLLVLASYGRMDCHNEMNCELSKERQCSFLLKKLYFILIFQLNVFIGILFVL
ncbi:hypothetical protein ACJX0J_026322, partial [Zea mays]